MTGPEGVKKVECFGSDRYKVIDAGASKSPLTRDHFRKGSVCFKIPKIRT